MLAYTSLRRTNSNTYIFFLRSCIYYLWLDGNRTPNFLQNEKKEMNSAKDIICFDLDGTLADYSEGWQGVENIGRPMGRAKKLLLELYKNYRIVIYTCRTNPALNAGYTQDQLVNYVEQWFTKHDLPYDEIYVGPGKPHAKVFLDDRAFFYNGSNNHENAIDRIKYLCQF